MSFVAKYYLGLILFLFLSSAYAVDTVNLDAGAISGPNWKLEGVKLEVNKLNQSKKTVAMTAARLTLPKPYHRLTLADIRCEQFFWEQNEVACLKGRASVKAPGWQALAANFSFKFNQHKGTFKLDEIRVEGSRLSLAGDLAGENWRANLKAEQVSYALLEKIINIKTKPKTNAAKAGQGLLTFDGMVSGRGQEPLKIDLAAKIDGLTDQTADGKVATEKLALLTHFTGARSDKVNNDWRWRSESKMLSGALYVEPVYLEAGSRPITLTADGFWRNRNRHIAVNHFDFNHPEAGRLTGSANAVYRDKVLVNQADVVLHSNTLQTLLTTYVNPFFTESPFTGMTAAGNLEARLGFEKTRLIKADINVNPLHINDEAGRLKVNNASGTLRWSENSAQTQRSEIGWQQLALKGLPVDAAKLAFISRGRQFNLAEKIRLPVLNGFVNLDQFSWQAKQNDEPSVSFAGSIADISLELLTKTLGWKPLSGNISGVIPGVNYRNKTLSLDGELLVNVFDGKIRLNNLSSSGLFGNLPTLKGDIAVENLDLEKLTRKFEFGSITGKLTGFVNNLVLENWHPVSFYAWFGTPDDDESSHKISQKAVNNIASIGGGGATDILSRSFLGFFDTFRYDKIGVGCYLHNGVCQMSGVAAAEQGYYLIKGGWLPRIDVMGYNTQVNWDVLVERLKRVASPDKAVIQ